MKADYQKIKELNRILKMSARALKQFLTMFRLCEDGKLLCYFLWSSQFESFHYIAYNGAVFRGSSFAAVNCEAHQARKGAMVARKPGAEGSGRGRRSL